MKFNLLKRWCLILVVMLITPSFAFSASQLNCCNNEITYQQTHCHEQQTTTSCVTAGNCLSSVSIISVMVNSLEQFSQPKLVAENITFQPSFSSSPELRPPRFS